MRVSVNLASRPFVELRPLYARLRLVMLALSVLALALGVWLANLSRQAAAANRQMDALLARTHAAQDELARNEARMHQPANLGVLERSQFLNALFARKSFSWTAVMMDLERVLPPGVQVTSIDPVISKEGDVSIRLRVSGDRDRAIQLVRNLERSQRFIAPRLAGESALTKEKATAIGGGTLQAASSPLGEALGNGVEFEIFSNYNPLPESHVGSNPAVRAPAQSPTRKPDRPKPAARPKPAGRSKPAARSASPAHPRHKAVRP